MTEALRIARHGGEAERAAIAAEAGTAPELLTFLAADPSAAVRAAVAANAATPAIADRLLAEDSDAAVRAALARRIGALARREGQGGRAEGGRGEAARLGAGTLAMLVEDAAVEVRAAIADAIAGLPDAPRDLVLRLARDTALAVAAPVIRLSPRLGEADLIALVAAPPAAFTRRAVAGRPDLPEAVAEAVADSADPPAITALLGNPSAAIREATLDRLAEGSGAEPAWQAALLRRPKLPPGAARALGAIVAGHLLEVLAARHDLPDGMAEALRARLAPLLEPPEHAAVREAAETGDRATLVGLLAAATGLARPRVEVALALRSPRVALALCWRAGWSAGLAEAVQAALVPGEPIRANAEGGYALDERELTWQIELLVGLPA